MTLSKEIHKFAQEDAEYIATGLAKYLSHSLDKEDSVIDRMPPERKFGVAVEAIFEVPGVKKYKMHWKYVVDDSVEISPRIELLKDGLESAINGEGEQELHFTRYDKDEQVPVSKDDIKLSTSIEGKQSVTAADDEIDIEDEFDSDVEDSDFSSDIDDLSDQVDDIQENLDDIVEDNPSIEIDNNISNHYIAECEECHSIFISALVESDQKVDRISGTCPLCEKDCDSVIKWVVKDVNKDE